MGFLSLFAFAKFSIIPVCCGNAILENLDFPMYVCERVFVQLIFHDVSPHARILRLVRSQYRDFKLLAEGRTIIDGGAAAVLGVLPSGRKIVADVRDRLKP